MVNNNNNSKNNNRKCFFFTFYIVNITEAPKTESAQVYIFVNFTCKGVGNVLLWTVEGSSLTKPSNQDREISVTTNNISVDVWSSVLTIRALPINDGINIGCIVVGQNSEFISKGATLTVLGQLLKQIVILFIIYMYFIQ